MLFIYCHKPFARLLCLLCANRLPLPHRRFSYSNLGSFICPHHKFLSLSPWPEWHWYLSRSLHNTQKGEWKASSSQKTGREPSFASRVYLSNVFSTCHFCFSMKIQLSCQTCITNDSVCFYKNSGILCNGTVYSSQIYVRFQDYFLIITCFSGSRRLKRKDIHMWESVDTLMQMVIKRLFGEGKCHTSFLFWSLWFFSVIKLHFLST